MYGYVRKCTDPYSPLNPLNWNQRSEPFYTLKESTFNFTLPWAMHPPYAVSWASDFVLWGNGVTLSRPAHRLDDVVHSKLSDHYGYEAEVCPDTSKPNPN